jgi:hypothetical protein
MTSPSLCSWGQGLWSGCAHRPPSVALHVEEPHSGLGDGLRVEHHLLSAPLGGERRVVSHVPQPLPEEP